ncbi:MAG: hypothetical protein ACYSVY_25795, partial [Planctomycetota bacterium]
FEVTVFLGPLRAEGTPVIQRVTYENVKSTRVVDINMGRGGSSNIAGSDSAEGIMRPHRSAKKGAKRDRPSIREYGPLDGIEQPEDRELIEE